jgi:hypothetical protein
MLNTLTLRSLFALTSVVGAVGMASCADKNEAEPAGGTIRGELNIAGATNAVTLTATDGKTVAIAPDAATGQFVFDKVAPGAYSLTAVPAGGYYAPNALPISVKAGQAAAAKLVFNRDYSMVGTMSWEQNGVLYTASQFRGSLSSAGLTVTGTTAPLPGGGTREVALMVPVDGVGNVAPFQGVGTYPLGTGRLPRAWGFYYLNGNFDQSATDFSNQQVGQVRVTRFSTKDNVARGTAASGTFEFVAPVALNTTGNSATAMTITNGKFDVTY